MDGPTVHRPDREHRTHDAWAAILGNVGASVDVASVRRVPLPAHYPRHGIRRRLDVVVDATPWRIGSIELRDVLMHPLEAVGVKARAVVFLPDDVLGVAEAGGSEVCSSLQKEPERAEHPKRTRGPEHRSRGIEPAGDPAVPFERRVAVGRIGDDEIERPVERHHGPAVPRQEERRRGECGATRLRIRAQVDRAWSWERTHHRPQNPATAARTPAMKDRRFRSGSAA